MAAYKLVVVSPFENYKRGDQICDQVLVNKILDPKSDMHHLDNHVRRVLMSEVEKQQFVVPEPSNESQPQAPLHQEDPLNLVSIKDEGDGA